MMRPALGAGKHRLRAAHWLPAGSGAVLLTG
jgi:hypothetical protein